MDIQRLVQKEYIALTLKLLGALENRDLDSAYLLRKKRSLYDHHERSDPLHLRKMEEDIFNHLTQKAPSWMEALISYSEIVENTPRPERLGFLWSGAV